MSIIGCTTLAFLWWCMMSLNRLCWKWMRFIIWLARPVLPIISIILSRLSRWGYYCFNGHVSMLYFLIIYLVQCESSFTSFNAFNFTRLLPWGLSTCWDWPNVLRLGSCWQVRVRFTVILMCILRYVQDFPIGRQYFLDYKSYSLDGNHSIKNVCYHSVLFSLKVTGVMWIPLGPGWVKLPALCDEVCVLYYFWPALIWCINLNNISWDRHATTRANASPKQWCTPTKTKMMYPSA